MTASPRLAPLAPEQATGQAAQLYAAIQMQVGFLPNIFQALGVAPRALEAFLHLGAGLAGLSGADKEAIALATVEVNGCDY